MGKCLSKDKNGGATAPAPVKLNGSYAHITVRELREERFPSGKAGRNHDACSLGRPVHETQYKVQDVTKGLNVAPLCTEDEMAVLLGGDAHGGGVSQVRETSSAEATLTHSVDHEQNDASQDIADEANGLGLAVLASAMDSGSGVSGVPEQLVVLPPRQVSRSLSPTAGRRADQRRRPSMTSTEFAGHFSDFEYPSPPRVEANASANSTADSPSSSPIMSVQESASVKSSVVKSTPTRSEVKPTKAGRQALQDISLNAPLRREQAHKRQLSKSPVLRGVTLTQEEAVPQQQVAKASSTDVLGTRASKRSRDWSTVPDDFPGITSMEQADKEAHLTSATQQTSISITLNVDIDSGLKGHSSISLRHEETLATESNASVTTTLSTSPRISQETGISSGPILLSSPTASCDQGWLISSLIFDQDKGVALQSKNVGSLELPSLDSLSHATDTEVGCSDVCGLCLDAEEGAFHCQVEEETCDRSEVPAENSFNQGQVGTVECGSISEVSSIPKSDGPQDPSNRTEPSMPLPCDPLEIPVQEDDDSGSDLGALPDLDEESLEVISTDSDVAERLLLEDARKSDPDNMNQQTSCENSEQEEHVSENDGADQRRSCSLLAEDLVRGTPKTEVSEEVGALEDSGQICVTNAQDAGLSERVGEDPLESADVEVGSAASNAEQAQELVMPSIREDGMDNVSSIKQHCGTNMVANCTAKVATADVRPVVVAVASFAVQVAEPCPMQESGNALLDERKLIDVEVSSYGSIQMGNPGVLEGLELTVEVVSAIEPENGILRAMEAVESEDVINIRGEGLAPDNATEMTNFYENADTESSGVSSNVRVVAFGSPFKETQVNEDTDVSPPSSIASAAASAEDCTAPSDISSGAFGSPFKEYVNPQPCHIPECPEGMCDNSDYQELLQTWESAPNNLEFEADVPIPVPGKITEESAPLDSFPSEPVGILPSPNKIPLQPSSDSFLVKLPPASKRTSSLPFIPRPPRPDKRVNESQVADLVSSSTDRPQRLSTSAPSSPQGPIFDLSQYSLPSTPGDSCPRRSSVDSRGSDGLIFDLSQFSLPSTPLSMSARSSPMSHSSTPKKLGHANAIALTREEIAEIWGAFEQSSHGSSPAAV